MATYIIEADGTWVPRGDRPYPALSAETRERVRVLARSSARFRTQMRVSARRAAPRGARVLTEGRERQ